jgi:hypothetical protein
MRPRRRGGKGSMGTKLLVEHLEGRALLAVNLISSFTGMNQLAASGPNTGAGFVTIYSPPDTTGAAGPTSYVEGSNQAVAIFTPKATGTTSVIDSADDFWFTQGGLTKVTPLPSGTNVALDNLSDITVIWDDLAQRFIIGDQDVNGSNSRFEVAVSKSASPATLTAADWNFYQVNTSEANRSADYPGNLGYNHDALVFTLNQNGTGGGVQVTTIAMSDLVAGNPITPHQTDISGFSIRPTVMHDSVAGDPMWLLESTAGNGNSVNVIRMDSVLSASPTFTTTSLSVNSYLGVVQPLQPDGTGLAPSSGNGALWTHILKAAEDKNSTVACDQVSVSATEDDARWYRIDVSGATPTLADQGNVSAGDKNYVVFPSIDINSRGDIGMTYLQSGTGTGQFMSMYITGRSAGDAAGTMQTPVLVASGVTNNTDGREGDLSGTSVDSTPLTVNAPSDQTAQEGTSQSFSLGSFTDSEGNFWAANEFAATGGSWGTGIGQFSLGTPGPWSVEVDWGDGTGHSTFSAATPGSLGTLNHTYGEEGPYTVTVKVTDPADGDSASKTYAVSVTDPAVQAAGVPVSAVEGSSFTGTTLAMFTDPAGAEPNPSDPTGGSGSHYKVDSIDWGDGTPLDTSSGALSFSGSPGSKTDPFTVSGSHTYGEEGTFTITAIIDHEGEKTTVTATAQVSDPAVMATGVPVFAVACTPLTGLELATFIDPGGAEPNPSDPSGTLNNHYKVVSIDWGVATPIDTTTGAITFSGSPGSKTDSFIVSGNHTFATEGTFTINVTLDHEGQKTTVTTTAVVKDKIGLLLLDPTGSASLMVTGNGAVTVNGDCGAVVVNSTASKAAFVTGNGVVSAGDFDVTGGVTTSGNAVVPSPVDHEAPTPDPLGLGLPLPLPPAPVGNTATMLHPGTYVGGLHISGKGAVTLLPGVYVMQGGGFSVTGQGSVSGTGVVIINVPGGPSGSISASGQAVVTLSAPTSGPFQGVAVLQVSNVAASFSGQANVTIAGVFYAPKAPVSITGNAVVTINPGAGTLTLPPIFGAMIAFDLQVSGNGLLTINPDDPPAAHMAAGGGGAASAWATAPVGGGNFINPTAQTDLEAMNNVAMGLMSTPDLIGVSTVGPKKKTS